MAAYWICRVRIAVDEEDDHAAIDIFEQAYRNNAQVGILIQRCNGTRVFYSDQVWNEMPGA